MNDSNDSTKLKGVHNVRIKIEISWDNEKNEGKGDENRTEQNRTKFKRTVETEMKRIKKIKFHLRKKT